MLEPRPVADFYAEFLSQLDDLSLPVEINTMPNEVPDGIPFEHDRMHTAYDANQAG